MSRFNSIYPGSHSVVSKLDETLLRSATRYVMTVLKISPFDLVDYAISVLIPEIWTDELKSKQIVRLGDNMLPDKNLLNLYDPEFGLRGDLHP